MNEIEILQKIKLCLQRADMSYQINVAFDPDEDGDCYFKEGLFYVNNIKTKYTAFDIISIKYKLFDYDNEENDEISYIRISFNDGDFYIYDSLAIEKGSEYIHRFHPVGANFSYYGKEAFKMFSFTK